MVTLLPGALSSNPAHGPEPPAESPPEFWPPEFSPPAWWPAVMSPPPSPPPPVSVTTCESQPEDAANTTPTNTTIDLILVADSTLRAALSAREFVGNGVPVWAELRRPALRCAIDDRAPPRSGDRQE